MTRGMRAAFYVGGGLEHGTGHLYRCKALAQGLETGDASGFLVDEQKTDLLELCADVGLECVPVAGRSASDRSGSVGALVRDRDVDVLVLDLFEVEPDYLRALRSATGDLPLVALDDYSITRPIPDVVIKPHLVEEWYALDSGWEGTTLLTGPDYWILRPGLREVARREREVRADPETVLVTMGGSDPAQVTREIVEVLGRDGSVPRLQVVCGPGYPDLERLQDTVDDVSVRTEVEIFHTPDDFDRLMFECDVAVTAGGYTVYELAALGTPMVIVPWVDHQTKHARAMESRGAAVALERVRDFDSASLRGTVVGLLDDRSRRRRMSAAGKRTVDGDGVERVTDVLRRVA